MSSVRSAHHKTAKSVIILQSLWKVGTLRMFLVLVVLKNFGSPVFSPKVLLLI